jgi:antitoxin component YwqK of YwqJK toxin-antitoxin module
MKILIQLFLCFCGLNGFTQTKIRITSPLNSQSDYQLENISDTTFIEISHKEDMGAWYGQSYKIKSCAPDGKYEVYVDSNLELAAFTKRNQKDSIWTSYYSSGRIRSIQTYKDGKANGERIDYHKNGVISYQGVYRNDKPIGISTTYFETGKVQAKSYSVEGIPVKQEVFDENGKWKFIYDPKTGTKITK